MYLIYPSYARRNIRIFLFLIELFNLINYVYGIIIASSEGIFYVGEVGNLIGIDIYEVHVRKYFNVIPTFRIIALIIITMTIWNTLPNEDDAETDDFEAKLYKTLYGYSKVFTEFIYSFFSICRSLVIWICYALIFAILIINDHSIKNLVLAIMLVLVIYAHCSRKVYYMHYFATYAGFVFISTWVYQFLKFEIVKDVLGITKVEHIPVDGEFWGYTVLTEKQLLFRVIALSALLVLSVIGSRSLTSNEKDRYEENDYDEDEVKQINDDELYYKVLNQREIIIWYHMDIFWPVINFIATFFHIPLTFLIVYQSIYWRLSWIMVVYLFVSIGPWFSLDVDFLGTKNLGRDKPLNFYSNIAVQEQRYKKWRILMWITIITWMVIFSSNKFLNRLSLSLQGEFIFYGVWAGLLYPNSNSEISFFDHVSGYLLILLFLVLEKKCLDWLKDEQNRQNKQDFDKSVRGEQHQSNYDLLANEIDRRKQIEDRKAGKIKNNSKTINFKGLDDNNKIDPKEKLKQEIDDAKSLLKKNLQREEMKKTTKMPIKSAMKKPKIEEEKFDGPIGPRPFEEVLKTKDAENEIEDEAFNILFTKDDPTRNETKKLLLFQYRIKFMRGAKTLIEECITLALLI